MLAKFTSSIRRAPTKPSRSPAPTEPRSCSFIIRADGPRNGSGPWIRCRFAYDWILLLDADEVLTPELAEEIRVAIQNPAIDGYSILLRTWFLGRVLRHGDVGLWKLSLFRRGKGRLRMPPQRSGCFHGRYGSA